MFDIPRKGEVKVVQNQKAQLGAEADYFDFLIAYHKCFARP